MRLIRQLYGFIGIKQLCMLLFLLIGLWVCSKTPRNVKSKKAVREVLEGKCTEANAAWLGFDEKDATENNLRGWGVDTAKKGEFKEG